MPAAAVLAPDVRQVDVIVAGSIISHPDDFGNHVERKSSFSIVIFFFRLSKYPLTASYSFHKGHLGDSNYDTSS